MATKMTEELSALDELQHEHEIAERLLERLVELGEGLKAGEVIPPKTLRYGVGLLEAYLHRVHAGQIDRELRPEAEAVAMPVCFEHLDRIRGDHGEMRRRAQQLLGDLRQWGVGAEGVREKVATELIELGSTDHEVAQYEDTYPLMCLQTALPDEAERRVHDRFARHRGTRAALEGHIEGFLARTGAVRA